MQTYLSFVLLRLSVRPLVRRSTNLKTLLCSTNPKWMCAVSSIITGKILTMKMEGETFSTPGSEGFWKITVAFMHPMRFSLNDTMLLEMCCCSSLIHLFPDNISIHSMTILRFPVVRSCFSEELRLSTIIVFTDRGCKKKHVLSTKEKLRLKEVKRCWFLNPRYW